MIIKCYIIDNTPECAIATQTIEHSIPCFTSYDLLDDGYIELTISCRAEDIVFVEWKLAPFV